ncbi:MAG: hypothetical protein K2X41_04830 [Hyphomicrobium sp.]|nr:hypothetical protein [Hyphomicrobium sp.]
MIAPTAVLIFLIFVFLPIYWSIPCRYHSLRLATLAFLSTVFLLALNPLIVYLTFSFMMIIGAVVTPFLLGWISAHTLRNLSWLCFVPIVGIEFVNNQTIASWFFPPDVSDFPAFYSLAFLGLSYSAIRSFIIVREVVSRGPIAPAEIVAALLFFPSFVAGPLVGTKPYAVEAMADSLDLSSLARGFSRIGWGIAVFLVLKPDMSNFDLSTIASGTTLAWLSVYRRFLCLYMDFTGYTELAIGTALLFGIRLPENFRYPLTAKSIQDFWQRWHLSLGAFISTYLFKPLVRDLGRPRAAIFMAFAFIGLWHSFTWNYLIWGVAHGGALALCMTAKRYYDEISTTRLVDSVATVGSWFATLSFVAVMSAFATAPDLASGLEMLKTLVGLGS